MKPPAFHFQGLSLLCVSACVTERRSEPCYQQIKIPPEEGVRHCSFLRTAGSSRIALPVPAANCTSALSFCVLLFERSQHRLTGSEH